MLRDDAEKSDSEQEKVLIKKANKPLIERKRRARINKCLFEIKQMLVDDIKNEYRRILASFPWDYTGENSVHHNNPECNNYQQTTIMQPSSFQILNHTTR
ncbi:unnamed protein product [Cercopithifilaria johnstoni]|uniref:BHLH domain-containing protein n=1 Tax=Cercopithifilaria johnstoni TaxID=2874296 RepID=A0A8J2M042_9BILA|nr:unnamed protein product [Cercopithifilaria johnstoni]